MKQVDKIKTSIPHFIMLKAQNTHVYLSPYPFKLNMVEDKNHKTITIYQSF